MPRIGSPRPAFEFLTTLRLPSVPPRPDGDLPRALWAFPLVGAVIGLALFGVERGGRELAPDLAVALVVVVVWIALTGGLHLDGLADAADGLFGGRDRAGRLAIMHDVHSGSWALIAVSLVLLAKFAFILALPPEGRFGALLLAPIIARGLIVAVMAVTPYARNRGYGRALHAAAWGAPAVVAAALTLGAAGALFDAGGLLIVLWVAAVVGAAALYARSKLGGLTGDVDGALIEIGELVALLGLTVALEQAWLGPLLWDGS